MTRRTGLFGGTFDPPHMGHLIIAGSIMQKLDLARVIFIPTGLAPHKLRQPSTPAKHRLKMLELALADNSAFEISDHDIKRDGPCFSIDTIKDFQLTLPNDDLFWLIGADSLGDLPTWYEFEELICRLDVVSAWRGGVEIDKILDRLSSHVEPKLFEKLKNGIVRTPMIEISATEIREMVSRKEDIRYLVPEAVRRYIAEEGLYVRC